MYQTPHNDEAERAAIAMTIALSKEFQEHLISSLSSDDFFHPLHGAIWKVINKLHDEQKPIELMAVMIEMELHPEYRVTGDTTPLSMIMDTGHINPSGIDFYIAKLKQFSILRKLYYATIETMDMLGAEHTTPEMVFDHVEENILRALERTGAQDVESAIESLPTTLIELERLASQSEAFTGISSGFPDIDDMLGGFHSGDLIILAARPSMGKTALAMNFASNACRNKKSVLMFSLEMTKKELHYRLLSSEGGVPLNIFQTPKHMTTKQAQHIHDATNAVKDWKLFITDAPLMNISNIRLTARREYRKHNIDMIIVDHLQLIRPEDGTHYGNRNLELSFISSSLKALAKELNVPVIALSQLSRGVESRPDKRPILSDLRDSGSLEQDADVVAFLYRDEYYNQNSTEKEIAELIIRKHRNGPVGSIKMKFKGILSKFFNLEKIQPNS